MSPPPVAKPGWKIEFTAEARRWYKGLNGEDTHRMAAALDQLGETGPALGRPRVDSIKGSRHHNMKELRSIGGNLRALFAFDPSRHAVILVGGDKTGDWKGWYRAKHPAGRPAIRPIPADQGKGGTLAVQIHEELGDRQGREAAE